MSQVFILQNQHKQFLSKQLDWADGRDAGSLYKTPHKDEALNQMFEVNAKDYSQRIKLLTCDVTGKGLPVIDVEWLSPLIPGQPTDSIPSGSKDATPAGKVEGNGSPFVEIATLLT
ncbi:MAG: hypothetical protein P8Y45_07335 [Exilibacterium sp.]